MKKIIMFGLLLLVSSAFADMNDIKYQNEVYNELMNLNHELKIQDRENADELSADLVLEQIRIRLKPFAVFNIDGVAEVKAAPQIEFCIVKR